MQTVTLTDTARERIRGFLDAEPAAVGLRFGVRKSGCSGFAYVIELAHALNADDVQIVDGGVPVVIDAASLPTVEGTEIDFVAETLGSRFVFNNPRVSAQCGCGESFTVDEAHAAG